MSGHPHARLINAGGELLAEGPCWFDQDARLVTMEPDRAPGVIQRERGALTLEFDSGDRVPVDGRPIVISTMGQNGSKTRRRLYRLRLGNNAQGRDNKAQDATAVDAGVRFLIGAQREDGSYPDERIAGVFNKTCAIHYDNYLKVFPLWALAEVRRHRRVAHA